MQSISEVRPFLFLAGHKALSEEKFKELGITHGVDCTNFPKPLRIGETEYMDVKGADVERFQIHKSATICLVYLLIHENLSLEEAYVRVSSVRRIAPNVGFWAQMIEFEQKRNGRTTVEVVEKIPPTIRLRESQQTVEMIMFH
ncbi:hypothetical protein M3Y96_00499300 [Aphelenchoides besseyi]|nr:hypothetical protein M3Y96_00498100 [Aphelenchoides besseyi]KAI6212052.1 hypothetical protein M3Y96_00499300 [Aphelenchoides besseyi]